jgi:hypothetical protein
MYVFRSEDEGDFHYINKFLAPKYLGLEIGCPVMLLVNLTEELVKFRVAQLWPKSPYNSFLTGTGY